MKKYKIGIIFTITAIAFIIILSNIQILNEPPEANQPNIIVIMTDDLDERSFNILIENGLMPNLQEYLLDHGIRFTNSFVTNPSCCPSRATFHTGQYTHNHHVLTNNLPDGGVSVFNDTSTLATWLHDSGYRTGLVGKYMNEYGNRAVISRDYIPPGWDSWQALLGGGMHRVYDYFVNNNGKEERYGFDESDYQTDVLSNFSTKFILETEIIDDSTPFFLAVMPSAPHWEFELEKCQIGLYEISIIRPSQKYVGTVKDISVPMIPSFNETDISDKTDWWKTYHPSYNDEDLDCLKSVFKNRLESMRSVDDMIGDIIQTLKETDELENTIVIFTSDNGMLLGEHRVIGKARVYEESIRVPLVIRIPEYSGTQNISHLVINNDLAPTILDFAGAKATFEMDGRSLKPLLKDPSKNSWREKFLIEFFSQNDTYASFFAVRTESSVYVEHRGGDAEFYDLNKDPYQLDSQHNCTSDICKKQIQKHSRWISDLKTCGNGSCFILEN